MYYEIGKNFYVLRSKEEDFHRNIYLKKIVAEDGSSINILFDPGTKLDMPELLPFLSETIGGIKNVHIIFLSHQDPDLTANTSVIMQSAPRSFLITSLDTWRLVKMYGLPSHRVKTTESFNSSILKFKKSGLQVKFVPARYCHFRGAMMLYDYESKVLFTGDFMGGINTRKGEGIYATNDSWEGIKLFHQLYMPASKAVKTTVERISMLNPFPEVIAPQHGDVIKGDLVADFLTKMNDLEVGIDLIEEDNPDAELVVVAINNFFELMEVNFGNVFTEMIQFFQKGNDFTTPFEIVNNRVKKLRVSQDLALLQIVNFINSIKDNDLKTSLLGILMDNLEQLDIKFSLPELDTEKLKKSHDSIEFDDMVM
ncbi:eukaryotic-like serine/threonine-protein kinase [Thermotomaculum hydrothermale]|uniref:Eukaryotic-like serine/threonine-protein kinase n=1 Tax=Thermotomaculum hydrothermale TaxID=981385 RepID=A0A7R6SXI6_9BACT|nr:hypothetical protein [Thermotomaculum hydrothermale]BBB31829.1 eukaryotic-like serine/threonine-protein kinase [Thermotomaculum hydrothermale]